MGNGAENTVKDLVQILVSVIEERDPYMKGHSERVATNCVLFSKRLGRTQKEINQIYLAGLLHDIGLVYIPLEITQKSEELTEDEMDMIKKHPLISEKIVSKHDMLKGSLPIIRHHHEAVDGSGYPDGLKGDSIPVGAMILRIVNTYDSMANARAKKPAMSMEDALTEIKNKAGRQFDTGLADEFVKFIQLSKPVSTKIDKKEEKETKKEVEEKIEGGTLHQIIQGIVDRFTRGNIDLPVLPKVVQDVQKVMNQTSATINEVALVIERDAVISVRLISVANSPVYKGAEKALTVKQAIPRLGFKETQQIVTTIANKSLYEVKDLHFKTTMEHLWLHSLVSAYITRAIASKLMLGDIDKNYFMGLTHDIGKVLLLKTFGDIYSKNKLWDVKEITTGIQEVHTKFGAAILRKWGFSEEFARISLSHEGPEFRPETDKDILAVNLASNIADNIGYGLADGEEVELQSLASARLLNIDSGIIDDLSEEAKGLMQETSNIF